MLGLENLGFIRNFYLQKETELEDGNFMVTTRFKEVGCLHRLWSMFGHNKASDTIKHALLKVRTERVPPSFFGVGSNIYDRFIDVIYPINYG